MPRSLVLSLGFALSLCVGAFVGHEGFARASVTVPAPVELGVKKCSFDSDCPFGKCGGGQCGACSFDSDCKGYGKCGGGRCGACSFDSDCKGFDGCKSGHCGSSPY